VLDAAQKGKIQIISCRGVPAADVLTTRRIKNSNFMKQNNRQLRMSGDDLEFERFEVDLRDFG